MLQQWLKSRQKLLKDTQDFSTRSWFRWCAGRITASVMHAVFATSLETPAQSVVNCVSYPENCLLHKQDGEWSMKRMHERPTPKKLQHITTNCRFVYAVLLWTQFFLNLEHLTMCDCCGEWCLEIKCPFKYTTDSIKQALDAQDKDWSQLQMDFT